MQPTWFLQWGPGLSGRSRAWALLLALTGTIVGVVQGAGARTDGLPALQALNSGRWELRGRDGSVQRICLGDKMRLVQLRHHGSACNQVVIDSSVDALTVQYTCRGRGYGRTHIRRESERLFQLETQGIAEGLPFEFDAEGRWVGECSS